MGPSPPPNPALQAILDAIPHINVPFSIQEGTIPNTNPPQTTTMVTCDAHKQVICKICDIHFGPINYMFNFLKGAPAEAIPPPPNAPTQPQRAEAIKQAKEAGNVCPSSMCEGSSLYVERVQDAELPAGRRSLLSFGRYGTLKTPMGTICNLKRRDSSRTM